MKKPETEPEIGKRFREIRNLLKMTQVEMSETLKVTQANLSQIENGDCLPNFKFYRTLSKKFPDVNFNFIITGSGSPFKNMEVSRIKNESASVAAKKVEKEYQEVVQRLEEDIAKLKKDNSKLIDVISKSK